MCVDTRHQRLYHLEGLECLRQVLSGSALVMYWLYAVSFMLIVFFTLLNFFLAIIVDAFVDVKNESGQLRCTQSFFTDLASMAVSLRFQRKYKLPPRKALVKYLTEMLATLKREKGEAGKDGQFPLVSAQAILDEFGVKETDVVHWLVWMESLSTVPLIHYHQEDNNAKPEATEPEATKPEADGAAGVSTEELEHRIL